jgi:ATP-dependent phosphofructokinase / diphosphate-dependent phosphofructokinase
MVLEVMGRHAGWIATFAGMAGGADAILIPEVPFDIDAVGRHLKHRAGSGATSPSSSSPRAPRRRRAPWTLPEHDLDEFGRPAWAASASPIAHEIEERTGFSCRYTILGHTQRGGDPQRHGPGAGHAHGGEGRGHGHGRTVGPDGGLPLRQRAAVPLVEAVAELSRVPESLYRVAEVFFG